MGKKGVGSHGISALRSRNNRFERNICVGHVWEGIMVIQRSPGHKIIGNYCAWNGLNGIYSDDGSHFLLIKGNWCIRNGWNRNIIVSNLGDSCDNEGIQLMTHMYYVLLVDNVCFANRKRGLLAAADMNHFFIIGNYFERINVDRCIAYLLGNKVKGKAFIHGMDEAVIIDNVFEDLTANGRNLWIVHNLVEGRCSLRPAGFGKEISNIHLLFNDVGEMEVREPERRICIFVSPVES